jgi:hypothetical protein
MSYALFFNPNIIYQRVISYEFGKKLKIVARLRACEKIRFFEILKKFYLLFSASYNSAFFKKPNFFTSSCAGMTDFLSSTKVSWLHRLK